MEAGPHLCSLIRDGLNIVIHYKGGSRPNGYDSARLLIEFGMAPQTAIQSVYKGHSGFGRGDVKLWLDQF
jgi:hypothetical protein